MGVILFVGDIGRSAKILRNRTTTSDHDGQGGKYGVGGASAPTNLISVGQIAKSGDKKEGVGGGKFCRLGQYFFERGEFFVFAVANVLSVICACPAYACAPTGSQYVTYSM